jgi:RNA polymerase sigma-70 factor, ECF subfamily
MALITQKYFETAFKEYFTPLCSYAYTLCKDADNAKEAVQQVFADIWSNRETIVIQSTLSGYLYRSVFNKIRNNHRNTRKTILLQLSHLANEIADDDDPPALNGNDVTGVEEMLSALPEQCRLIFTLKRLEGLSYREIASRLNVCEKTVENQMGIALKKLRTIYQSTGHREN